MCLFSSFVFSFSLFDCLFILLLVVFSLFVLVKNKRLKNKGNFFFLVSLVWMFVIG